MLYTAFFSVTVKPIVTVRPKRRLDSKNYKEAFNFADSDEDPDFDIGMFIFSSPGQVSYCHHFASINIIDITCKQLLLKTFGSNETKTGRTSSEQMSPLWDRGFCLDCEDET